MKVKYLSEKITHELLTFTGKIISKIFYRKVFDTRHQFKGDGGTEVNLTSPLAVTSKNWEVAIIIINYHSRVKATNNKNNNESHNVQIETLEIRILVPWR